MPTEAAAVEPQKTEEVVKNPFVTLPADRRDKTRDELLKVYYDTAFQVIVDAEFNMTFLPDKQKKLDENTKELEQLNAEIKAIEEGTEYHTRQNRDLVKLKKDQVAEYEAANRGLKIEIDNLPQSLKAAYSKAADYIKKAEFIAGYSPAA